MLLRNISLLTDFNCKRRQSTYEILVNKLRCKFGCYCGVTFSVREYMKVESKVLCSLIFILKLPISWHSVSSNKHPRPFLMSNLSEAALIRGGASKSKGPISKEEFLHVKFENFVVFFSQIVGNKNHFDINSYTFQSY